MLGQKVPTDVNSSFVILFPRFLHRCVVYSTNNTKKGDCRTRTGASKANETGPRSPISLLEINRMGATDATLDPFRTVSVGSLVNEGLVAALPFQKTHV